MLRRMAEIRYVTDPQGISSQELSEIEPFKGVVRPHLMCDWRSKHDWVEKRKKYFDGVSDSIKKKLGKRLVSIQVEQLKELDTLYHDAIAKLKERKLKPKTLEGMITALVKLVTASNELRDRIAREIVPENLGGTRDEGMQVTPKLTESEARAAAKAIIHERRAKMRAAAGSDSAEADDKPQLRVVEGGADEQSG